MWAVLVVPAIISFLEPVAAAPLETYGHLPSLEDIALSPGGKRLAFVRTRENQRVIAIADLPNTLISRMSIGEVELRDLTWADDDHLMITTSTTGLPFGFIGKDIEWKQLSVYEVSTRKLRTYPEPADKDIQTLNTIVDEPMVRHIGNDTVLFLTGLWVSELAFEDNADRVSAINILRAGHARCACVVSDAVRSPAAGTHRSDSGSVACRF